MIIRMKERAPLYCQSLGSHDHYYQECATDIAVVKTSVSAFDVQVHHWLTVYMALWLSAVV